MNNLIDVKSAIAKYEVALIADERLANDLDLYRTSCNSDSVRLSVRLTGFEKDDMMPIHYCSNNVALEILQYLKKQAEETVTETYHNMLDTMNKCRNSEKITKYE